MEEHIDIETSAEPSINHSKLDLNRDGSIDSEEVRKTEKALELELREQKADTQRRIAWTSMLSMIVFTILLFTPLLSDSRVTALSDLFGLFYVAQAGIVGAYFGFTTWMQKG
jgi:hypothetical protein